MGAKMMQEHVATWSSSAFNASGLQVMILALETCRMPASPVRSCCNFALHFKRIGTVLST